MAFWFEDPRSDITYYEANLAGAYSLIQSGKQISFAGERLGSVASAVTASILGNGSMELQSIRIPDDPPERQELKGASLNGASSPSKRHGGLSKASADNTKAVLEAKAPETGHAVHELLAQRFLLVSHDSLLHSKTDTRALADFEESENSGGNLPLSSKDNIIFQLAIDRLLERWERSSAPVMASSESHPPPESLNGFKRRIADSPKTNKSNKKRRLNDCSHQTEIDQLFKSTLSPSISTDSILRFNIEKTAVVARTEKLVQLAAEEIGAPASEVFNVLLQRLEITLLRCGGVANSPEINDLDETVTTHYTATDDLFSDMDIFEILEDGLGQAPAENIDLGSLELDLRHEKHERKRSSLEAVKAASKKRKRGSEGGGEFLDGSSSEKDSDVEIVEGSRLNGLLAMDSEAEDDNKFETKASTRPVKKRKAMNGTIDHINSIDPPESATDHKHLLRQHLFLLASHNPPLLHHHPARTYRSESWSIPIRSLAAYLRFTLLISSISSRYGSLAARLARLLHSEGRLDTKTLAARALVKEKDLRTVLERMKAAGHVELQEVPRDNQRAPSRTMFLWGFDLGRCGRIVLQETYRAIRRCLERLRAEREKVQGLLEKAGRTDVVGREEDMLPPEDLAGLKRWRAMEERIWGEVGRLDDIVMVLRDF